MKRLLALMIVVALTALVISCTKKAEEAPDRADPEPQYAGADTVMLRVVDGTADGTLVLAGKAAGEVYMLPLDGLTLYLDGGSVDAITSATITSRAVTSGVNAALECAGKLG